MKVHSGSLDDPEVEVLSTIGIRLAGDDDSGLNSDAAVSFAPTLSGYYYIGVAGSGNSSKGTYQVRVKSVPDDYAGDLSTDAILTIDQPQKGMLQTTNDRDWFKVGLTEGRYILKAYADNAGEIDPLRDPYLILRDEAGQALLWSDDSATRWTLKFILTLQRKQLVLIIWKFRAVLNMILFI